MKDPLLVPRSFYDRWQFKITPAARYLGWGLVASGLGSISVLIPVYQTFCGLAALLGFAWLAGWLMKPRLAIAGGFPDKTSAGRVVAGEFTLTNLSRRPALDVAAGVFDLQSGLRQSAENRDRSLTCLRRGESARVTVPLQAQRRGLYELPDVRAYSLFPFHLVRSGHSRARLGSLLVLPAFHPLDAIRVPSQARYQPGGIALSSNVGESPEYIGNREYVPGEPARRLDFRSWARTGKPVVREYQEEYYCRIALILDTHIPPSRRPSILHRSGLRVLLPPFRRGGRGGSGAPSTRIETKDPHSNRRPSLTALFRIASRWLLPTLPAPPLEGREPDASVRRRDASVRRNGVGVRTRREESHERKAGAEGFTELEAAVSLAAAVADALSNGEYLIDLFAAGPELYVFHAGRHTAHFENILEILACVDACRTDPFQTIAPAIADELANISTTVCILLDWDDARRQLVRTIAEAGCTVKVLLVRDGPTSQPFDGDCECVPLTTAAIRQGGLGTL